MQTAKKNTTNAAKAPSMPLNKGKAAPKPAQAKAAETDTEITITDEADDEKAPKVRAKGSKKSQKAILVQRVARVIKRLDRIGKECSGTEELEKALESARSQLGALQDAAEALPSDWTRTRSSRVMRKFDVGKLVAIVDGRKPAYDGLIEKDEMDELRVVKQVDKKVVVKTASGEKMFIPAWHLRATEG